jgi:hypothetical protein
LKSNCNFTELLLNLLVLYKVRCWNRRFKTQRRHFMLISNFIDHKIIQYNKFFLFFKWVFVLVLNCLLKSCVFIQCSYAELRCWTIYVFYLRLAFFTNICEGTCCAKSQCFQYIKLALRQVYIHWRIPNLFIDFYYFQHIILYSLVNFNFLIHVTVNLFQVFI